MIGSEYPAFYELVSKCLTINPRERITASDALALPFFKGDNWPVCLKGSWLLQEGVKETERKRNQLVWLERGSVRCPECIRGPVIDEDGRTNGHITERGNAVIHHDPLWQGNRE